MSSITRSCLLLLALLTGCAPATEACCSTVHTVPVSQARLIQPSSSYPGTTCPVTGRGLDELGMRSAVLYHGRELQTCCRHCAERVMENPELYYGRKR